MFTDTLDRCDGLLLYKKPKGSQFVKMIGKWIGFISSEAPKERLNHSIQLMLPNLENFMGEELSEKGDAFILRFECVVNSISSNYEEKKVMMVRAPKFG